MGCGGGRAAGRVQEVRRLDPRDRLIVALDTASQEAAAEALAGPAAVWALARRGRVFLDLKYHDIPAAVTGAVAAAAHLGVAMCTVHASGGAAMLRAAREAAGRAAEVEGGERPKIIGVTLLTSEDPIALDEVGVSGSPREMTLRLARLAQDAGCDGVVASPLEAAAIRAACGAGFLIVCPGIRPGGAAPDDQRRVGTPREAIAAGADFLVVGRPITRAADPRAAFAEIAAQMAGAAGA